MAERRMFAKTIIDSDAFLDLPERARLLYYDLSMRADDDGFVNAPKKIARMIGAGEADLDILVERKFIIRFDSGVVAIKHWLINNFIRKDTYRETMYKEEKDTLELDENSAYRQIRDESVTTDGNKDRNPVTAFQNEDRNPVTTDGNKDRNPVTGFRALASTQDSIGKDSIGKDRLGKDSLGEDKARARFVPPTLEEVKAYCQERQNNVNPEKFINHYQSNGWMVGKSKMKDWRAAVRTWEHNGFDNKGKAPPGNELDDFYNFANEWAESGE